MDCTLFIPHLLPPHELGDALWRTVEAPQLKALLARATLKFDASTDADSALCALFGIARQHDCPFAPILAAHHSLDADNGYWLNATPVHLEARRNALILAEPAALAVNAEESTAFADTLAQHLRDENLTLHAPQAGRWLLRSDAPPAITTSSLRTVTGRDVRPFLPQGSDSARWHRILTEIQMLLHAHPLNDAREARGQLPVNSVWLWGGGTMPALTTQPQPQPITTVWSDCDIVRACANHTACRIESMPTHIAPDAWQQESHKGSHLLLTIELLEAPMRQGDAQRWSNAVTALNRDWFMPLIESLNAQRLKSLTIISSNDNGTRQFVAHPGDKLKFWRKNKYL